MDECLKQRNRLATGPKQYRDVFLALGDENRQLIFLVLLENDKVGMRVPDIASQTHLSRPAVSHHLKILKETGLVNLYRIGTRNDYYVEAESSCWKGLQQLTSQVEEVMEQAKQQGYPPLKEEE